MHRLNGGVRACNRGAHDTVSKSGNAQSSRPDRNLAAKIRQPSCHRVNPNSNVTIVNESFSKSAVLSAYSALLGVRESFRDSKTADAAGNDKAAGSALY